MSDKLKTLEPEFRRQVEALLGRCVAIGITMVPYFTLRTPHDQARLWRQSRPRPIIDSKIAELHAVGAPFLAGVLESVGSQNGPHVTNALPGTSWHQWGEAVDCYWQVNGDAEWSTTRKINGKNGYQEYARIAEELGLDAGGHWSSFKDWPHVQLSAKSSPLQAGKTWPQIDQAMEARFGGTAPVVNRAAHAPLHLAYRSDHGWRAYYTDDVDACVFRGAMMICADGAPNAYHQDNAKALDYLANAGRPGNWWAIVTDTGKASGNPLRQKPTDPAPGYYISTTAMVNASHSMSDPRRYVDATKIPYVVLPGGGRYTNFHPNLAPRLGDLAVVHNMANGIVAGGIFAEIGPVEKLGEASIALAERLGVNADPKTGGSSSRNFRYMVFPGTKPATPQGPADLEAAALGRFERWGGLERLDSYSIP